MNTKELTLKKLEMSSQNLKNLIDLQDKIIKDLKPNEQHFILHRTIDDFSKSLSCGYMHVFGLYDGDRLVSQSILSLPTDDVQREIPEFGGELKNSEIAVFKAVLVDPEYRGHGLMKKMLNIRENMAIVSDRKMAITQIAADNPASWVNAMQYGMQITKVSPDPEDGAKVIYLQKRLDGKIDPQISDRKTYKMYLGQDVHKNVPALFNKMMQLSAQGMVGTNWNKEKNYITWQIRESEENQKSSSNTKAHLYRASVILAR